MTNTFPAASSPREVVFVDSRVQDATTLLKGFPPGAEVVFLQPGEDGLAQMAAALGQRGDVGAVHVLAHGSAGQLWLGTTFLDASTLAGQAEALAALGRGLTEDGDLLVYACDLARGEAGTQFVALLAELTGSDVAASDDRTGMGGDWELEITTGRIAEQADVSHEALAAYDLALATLTVTINADSGADASFGINLAADEADGGGLSLREALNWAQSGDTITFNAGMIIGLSTKASGDSLLLLNKNLIIDGDVNNDGTADVTLDGQYLGRVLEVTAGTTATLDGLVITHGSVSGAGGRGGGGIPSADGADALGAGLWNAGTLTINNTSVTANGAAGGGGGGGGDQHIRRWRRWRGRPSHQWHRSRHRRQRW